MKKSLAEFIGTFTLVFLGCGAVIFTGALDGTIGQVGIALTFGLALIGMAYGIGPVSGCHINPAVSLGAVAAGRMSIGEAVQYIIAQVLGAILAALVLMIIANGSTGSIDMSANGWGEHSVMSAFLFELVATFLFVVVILGSTGKGASPAIAGLAIGLTLTAIHLVGITLTGVSVNPARSIGPALFSGSAVLGQLWLFIVAPILGGVAAGIVFKTGLLDAEE